MKRGKSQEAWRRKTGRLRISKYISLLIAIILISMQFSSLSTAKADVISKYGIVIADQKNNYYFYDFNSSGKIAGIEITSSGEVMVPLKELTDLMPALEYNYDAKSKKTTVKNTVSGCRIVYTKDSKTVSCYANTKAKRVKNTMTYKMYLSKDSSSIMVPASSLQWVMGTTSGYQYYEVDKMQLAGYDTWVYSGLIAYNPYKPISAIPKATTVGGISSTVKVTIPEGYTVAQIFDLLVKKGACASTEFLYDALEDYDFSEYSLIKDIKPNENRCFLLEGYLYPDTYEFYRLSKGSTVISKILNNMEKRITNDIRAKAAEMGYTTDEILTIASLIEKETGDFENMPIVASVIYNRLNKPMRLELDCTRNYITFYVKPYISGDENRYNSFYNTYKCSALPAGPICNPGAKAIQAALNPSQTDYFFFFSDPDGNYHFTATIEEHEAIQAKYNTDTSLDKDKEE